MEYPVLDAKKTGERIRELRKRKHIKVEEVAAYMGFESVQAIYKWQRGDSLPTVDNLYALSKLFETPIDSILQGQEEEDRDLSSFLLPLLQDKEKWGHFLMKKFSNYPVTENLIWNVPGRVRIL